MLNQLIKYRGIAYSNQFQTIDYFTSHSSGNIKKIEIMLHPEMADAGIITDHYKPKDMDNWLAYLQALSSSSTI